MIADAIKILHWIGAASIAITLVFGVLFFINAAAAYVLQKIDERKLKK